MPEPDPQLDPRQFMENMKGWEPGPDMKGDLSKRLKTDGLAEPYAEELSGTLDECAGATFRYIRLILGYATDRELTRQNFIPSLAELAESLQGLSDAGVHYAEAFRHFNETGGADLKSDRFETLYFDVIQGLDLQDYLKDIIKEVMPLLQAMTLTSAELKGAHLTDLFEQCVRTQMYLRYFLMSEGLKREETWSVLFDVYNLFSGGEEGCMENLLEDLDEIREELDRVRKSN